MMKLKSIENYNLRKSHIYNVKNSSFNGKENACLLGISLLYYNDVISYEKMLGMLKSLRNGDLLKIKNTYHCNIDDKWYNGVDVFKIFDVLLLENSKVSWVNVLQTVKLYLNVNKHQTKKRFYYQIFESILSNHWDDRIDVMLNSMNITIPKLVVYSDFQLEGYLVAGYCCEDCDGDFHQYKENRYRRLTGDNRKKVKDFIKEKLNLHELN